MRRGPLTTGEIANYCHVTYRAVLKWIVAGKLKAYRTPGQHSRVEIEGFLDFLKEYNMPIPDEFTAGNGRKKILIVDDDKNMARSIERILILKERFELEMAFDGFDAGRKVVMFKPDLVILDIRMPGMDGYEVTKRIKEIPELSYVKIIAISAFFEQEGEATIISLGADACLNKPFNEEMLLQTIEDLIGIGSS